MSGIKDYSTTPANNNATPPNGFPEGMAPASLNDGMRQVMADIRSWYENPEWIDFGNVPTQTGANTFTLATDLTARYTVGTRIRMIGTTPFTLYGTISASSYSSPNTTVTVTMDSGSLNSTLNAVAINQALKTSQYFLDSLFTLMDNSDTTKKLAFQLSGITTATTRTVTMPDKSGTMAMTSDIVASPPIRGYLDGYIMSTAGSSATMTIAAGQATDTTATSYITRTTSINKTTSSWVVGDAQGGLDTGTIANNTWYHFYAILRPDTSVVDVCFSTSASAPTTGGAIPAAYTLYRRIGSGKTNGSAQWVKFVQYGDLFLWDAAVLDITNAATGSSPVTGTLPSVPLGIETKANLQFYITDNGVILQVSPVSVSAQSPSSSAAPLGTGGSNAAPTLGNCDVMVSTTQTFRYQTNSNTTVRISVSGWTDTRGKQ